MSPFSNVTVGMAHFEDFDGVYFTIQSLRLQYPDLKFVVVDNSPGTAHGIEVRKFVEQKLGSDVAKYVPIDRITGTSVPRNMVFEHAETEYVICMDCHVLLAPKAITNLLAFYHQNPGCPDLIQGPMLVDRLNTTYTHFDPFWQDKMFGVWSAAWSFPDGQPVTAAKLQDKLIFVSCDMQRNLVRRCGITGNYFPQNVDWSGHEAVLMNAGMQHLGNAKDVVFEIPAQGLGMFACRKESWLGFNPYCTGFGGEEGYIHEKFRQAGRSALCLSSFRWLHRFHRPGGVKYPMDVKQRIRNYVLNWRDLGWSFGDIEDHFVPGSMSKEEFDKLCEDPIEYGMTVNVQNSKVSVASGLPQPPELETFDDLYNWTVSVPRDLNEHLPRLRAASALCKTVAEFSKRRESSIGLLAGKPAELRSYLTESDALTGTAMDLVKKEGVTNWKVRYADSLEIPPIQPVDMLFIDTHHNAERVLAELDLHGSAVNRFIAFHDTHLHGIKGDDGKAGLHAGIREWMLKNPKWFVHYHDDHQYGLTIIGQLEEDRPEKPIWPWPPGFGPGTELKKQLSKIGIVATPDCSCNARANTMDANGIEWCQENIETIVGWLREESSKRQLPFADFAGRLLVKRSIKLAAKQLEARKRASK